MLLYPSHVGKSYTAKNTSLANKAVPGGFTILQQLKHCSLPVWEGQRTPSALSVPLAFP